MHNPSFMGLGKRSPIFTILNYIYVFVCLFTVCVCAHMPWYTCGSQRKTCASHPFLPPLGLGDLMRVLRFHGKCLDWLIQFTGWAIFYHVFLRTKAVPCLCSSGEVGVNFPSSLCSASAQTVRGTQQALSTSYWRSSGNHG